MFYLRKVGTFPESPTLGVSSPLGNRRILSSSTLTVAPPSPVASKALANAREEEQIAIQHSKFVLC